MKRKVLIYVIIAALVIALFPKIEAKSATAYATKKISEIRTDADGNMTINGDVTLELDKETTVNDLVIKGNAVIKGDKKLKTTSIYVTGNLEIAANVNIDVNGRYARVKVDGDMKTAYTSKLTIVSGRLLEEDESYALWVRGQMQTSADITIDSKGKGICVDGDVKEGSQKSTYEFYIGYGNINIKCEKYAIFSSREIFFNNADIVINCKESAITGYHLHFNGGYVESNCSALGDKSNNVLGTMGMGVGTGMVIAEPEGGKMDLLMVRDDLRYYVIIGPNGKIPSKVIVKERYHGDDQGGGSTPSLNNEWKHDSKGWWYQYSRGGYPAGQWDMIDNKWYYFCSDGYMDYSEYRDGCWLGADGAWVEAYSGGHWSKNSTGWWYEDASGWYPAEQWLWIDGTNYYFNADGYLVE